MTPDELCQIGQSFYGPFWKAKLAAALPVSTRTVSYWLAKRKKISPLAEARIRDLVAGAVREVVKESKGEG